MRLPREKMVEKRHVLGFQHLDLKKKRRIWERRRTERPVKWKEIRESESFNTKT